MLNYIKLSCGVFVLILWMFHTANGNLTLKENQICRYRDRGIFPISIFSYWAAWGCYSYTRGDLFVGGMIIPSACNIAHDNKTYVVPGILDNNNCVPFDHQLDVIQTAVHLSFENDVFYHRWISCCNDANFCCENVLAHTEDKKDYCSSLWDGWSCIEEVLAGVTGEFICSPYSYTTQAPRCHHYSYKQCFENSTWNVQTDYSTCSITPRLITRTKWHIAMVSISLTVCIPAMFLLIFYKVKQSQKFVLIRNLIIAIISRNIFVLMSKSLIVLDELTAIENSAMSTNSWCCKLLAFLEKLATNAVFTCMLIEGIFLHQLLTNVFANRDKNGPNMFLYNIVGLSISIMMAMSWSIVMSIHADFHCWIVTDSNQFHWINDAARLIMLLVNTFLLSHILYTIWRSFQNRENEHQATLRTVKASLYCMPLFGIPFLFFIIRPDTDSCTAEEIYYFISYGFEGLQGVFVPSLHCYADKEIQKYIQKIYHNFASNIRCLRKKPAEMERRRSTIDDGSTVVTVADNTTAFNFATISSK